MFLEKYFPPAGTTLVHPVPMDDSRIKQLALALAVELGKSQAPQEPVLDDLWLQYKASRQIQPITLRGYTYTYYAQFQERFGHLRPNEITIMAVEEWRSQRRVGKTKRGTPTTVGCRNSELKCLKSILAWASKVGLIARNPIGGVELERDLARRETIHTPSSYSAVERHADKYMWAMFTVSVSGGMRKQEMRFLRWTEVDEESGIVRIRPETGKGGQGRFTVISTEAIKALQALRAWQADQGIKSRWVFPAARNTDKHVSDQTITWRWNRLRELAGIKGPDGNVWLHDSRRTFSSYSTPEIGMADTLTLGGWKSAAVMLHSYHRIPPKRIKMLRAGVDRMVAGLKIKPAK